MVSPGFIVILTTTCESDELVTGGGYSAEDDVIIQGSWGPYLDHSWQVSANTLASSLARAVSVTAMCLTVGIFSDGFESGTTDNWSSVVP